MMLRCRSLRFAGVGLRLRSCSLLCNGVFSAQSFHTNSFRDQTSQSQEKQEQNWKYLRNTVNGAEIFIVGTCHISNDSASFVKEIIGTIKPDAVALELCGGRAQQLQSEGKVQTPSVADFLKLPGSFGQQAFQSSIKSLQDLLKLFGINYGEEFRVAMDEGEKIQAKLHYIDQDINVTLRELKRSLSIVQVTKFVMSAPQHIEKYPDLFENVSKISGIEDFITNKQLMREMFKFLEDHFPEAMKAILHDRNELMVQHLRQLDGRIVAVVGLAHIEGMQELWQKMES